MQQLWGRDVLFEVRVAAQEVEEKKEVKIPDEVNLFVKVFKGEIVGGKV